MVDIVRVYSDVHGLFIKPNNGNLNIYRPQRSKYTRPSIRQLTNGFASELRPGSQVRVRHACSGSGTIELALLNSSYSECWCSHGPIAMDGKKFDTVDVWKPYEEPTNDSSNTEKGSQAS